MIEAHQEYSHRHAAAQRAASLQHKKHIQIGNTRLLVFVLLIVVAWFSFAAHRIRASWILAPLAAFVVLAFVDDAVLREKRRAERRTSYYERGIARLEERWRGGGRSGTEYAPSGHVYAADLDLFGVGSLFELLSVARTGMGEERLARWLLEPASPEEIGARHAAVRELAGKLDFRERLAIGGESRIVTPEAMPLWHWGEGRAIHVTTAMRWTALVLSAATALAMAWFAWGDFLWLAGATPRPPLRALQFLIVSGAATGIFALFWRVRVVRAVDEFEKIRTGLSLFAALLVEIEQEQFASAPLQKLQQAISVGHKPSEQIRKLNRFSDLLDSRDNVVVRIFGPALLWTTQVAFGIERWKNQYGRVTKAWVEAVAELEALSSLATFAYEHPSYPFPELLTGPPAFEARAIGHPLLAEAVVNDIALGGRQSLVIVSGSNMSGKSTMLRTIGTNTVLACAGAPVRAQSLRLTPLRTCASLRVGDSLQEGASHFSAEIKRIRQIVDLAATGRPPALFLIDEILQGTNSHDRLIGTQAIVHNLLSLGAIGAITTHDLALTKLVDDLRDRAVNVHFEDQLIDGKMSFDYKLKPGVVRGSNAVELMRLYGLV